MENTRKLLWGEPEAFVTAGRFPGSRFPAVDLFHLAKGLLLMAFPVGLWLLSNLIALCMLY